MNRQFSKKIYKTIASLAAVTSAFFLVGYIVYANNAPFNEKSMLIQENERLKNQLEELESIEATRKVTEELAEQFFLAMVSNDREAMKPLLVPESTVLEEFKNNSFGKINMDDTTLIRLHDYRYIQEISPKLRDRFILEYKIQFHSQEAKPLLLSFHLVNKKGEWLIESIENHS